MTTCTFHSGIEAKIDAICKKIDLRFNASDKAIDLARQDMERRLDGMNEFREQLSAQANTFLPRIEANLQIEKLITRLVVLEKSVNFREGSKHWSDYIITALIAAIMIVLSKLMHL